MRRHGGFCVLAVSLVVASVPFAATARAQEKHGNIVTEIDRIFSWAAPTAPGCSVAVAHKGELVATRAYGLADLERNVPITPDTIFDAASIVKQFVAAATLILVEEGKLSLTEDIRKYVPELPDYGHKITIDHLLTHTSGIRDWTGMLPLMANKVDALTLTLRQRGLNFAPGDEWAYSNGGYVLLKEIVARTSGMSFDDFTQKRLFEPLGMKSTSYRTDLRKVVRNRALAYEKDGDGWRLAVLLDKDRGGGGALLSTPTDLILWNEALASRRLGAFVTGKLHEPARLNNGRKLGYARGLILDENRGGSVIWHSGGAEGYESIVARYPEQALSIAIMCNLDDSNRTAYARQIFDRFVPAAAERRKRREEITEVAGVEVSGRAGLYFSERTGQPLQLVVNNGKLRIAGGPPLVATAEDRFRNRESSTSFLSDDRFELRFLSQDAFELRSMERDITRYRRAGSWRPAGAEMQAFAGRYESDEIGSVFEVVPAATGLVVRLAHALQRSMPMKPVDRDTFQVARLTFRFVRDARGTVIGLDYSNPVVRNIRFMRVEEKDCR